MKACDDLKTYSVSKGLLEEVPARVALHYSVLPLETENGTLRLAAPAGLNRASKEELRIVLGREVSFVIYEKEEIKAAISRIYGMGAGVIESLTEDKEKDVECFEFEVIDQDKREAQTIIRLVNELFLDALHHRASDIHIEPFEKTLRIRYRVDGILEEAKVSLKIRRLAPNLVSRLKIMANLDIGEKRLPQDGRIKVKRDSEELDLRISVLPSPAGEAVVIRILKPLELLNLRELGFDSDVLATLQTIIQQPNGIVLVTGPTGSGKTTTLYSCLKEINTVERKIITIEDPIEYKLPGIIQMQANNKIGFTFAKALRSMLRHDPDCLMVGEIRDQETAEIAIRSALTGHLVFSTLHTNDAPSAVTRLLEMGIAPYLVASSLEAVIAQRLVRMICEPCEKCQGSGFFGRTVIYELLTISDNVREMILSRVSAAQIRRRAIEEGMVTLRECGEKQAARQITSEQEIRRTLLTHNPLL